MPPQPPNKVTILKGTPTGNPVPSDNLKAMITFYLALAFLKGASAKAK